jgi:zinc/manganese transport system permease protein
MDGIIQPFIEFAFLRRALAGCVTLSFSAAPIGVFLILRRMSLAGDAMSHAVLPGIAAGYLLAGLSVTAMTIGGIAAGISVALLSGAASRGTVLKEDATLAAFYLIAIALGVTMISWRGSAVDLQHVLFGSVLALDDQAMILLGLVSTITLVGLAFILRPLVLECVDPAFLRALKGHGALIHSVFLVLVVLNLVAGFQALGTMMAVGMMVLPAAAARFFAREITGLMLASIAIALMGSVLGLFLSIKTNLPSGPAIVLMLGSIYLIAMLLGPFGGLLWQRLRLRHYET